MKLIHLTQVKVQRWTVVILILKLRFPGNVGNLTSCVTTTFPRTSLLWRVLQAVHGLKKNHMTPNSDRGNLYTAQDVNSNSKLCDYCTQAIYS